MAPSRWSSQRLSYTRREVTEKKRNRKERERSRWPRRASSASWGAQPPSESGILLSTRDQWQARRARERLFYTVRMCPLVVRWWTNDTHVRSVEKKNRQFQSRYDDSVILTVGRIASKSIYIRISARCEQVRKVKCRDAKGTITGSLMWFSRFWFLVAPSFQPTVNKVRLFFPENTPAKTYPFRTANSTSYFAFRPRGRVTDVIRAILSWIKNRVNANVPADVCVVEDLWDSRLSRLNFYYPTTGRPQILRSIIIYCCRVIYEQRRACKFVQPRHWKIPFDFDNVIRVECVGGIYVIRRVDGVWLSRFTGYGKISLP